MIKKLLLVTSFFSVSVISGNPYAWKGFNFFAIGAMHGEGVHHKDDNGKDQGQSSRSLILGLGAGYGYVFSRNIFAGASLTLPINTTILHKVDTGTADNPALTSIDPKVTLRLGYSTCRFLPFIGGGAGGMMMLSSDKDKIQNLRLIAHSTHGDFPKKEDGSSAWAWTWHVQIGLNMKVSGPWYCGIYYEYQRTFRLSDLDNKPAKKTDKFLVNDKLVFSFGYQM